MKYYLRLLLFNVIGFIAIFIFSMLSGSGGNTDPSIFFIGWPLIGVISFVCFIIVTVRHKEKILQYKWSFVPAIIILVANIQALKLLYFLLWNRFGR